MNRDEVLSRYLTEKFSCRQGDKILVVADETCRELGKKIYSIFRSNIKTDAFYIQVSLDVDSDFPYSLESALKSIKVMFVLTENTFCYPPSILNLFESNNIKVVQINTRSLERLLKYLEFDTSDLSKSIDEITKLFSNKDEEYRINTPLGTNFSFKFLKLYSSDALQERYFSYIPQGVFYIIPQSDSIRGVVYIDGSVSTIGKLDEPIEVVIERGKIIFSTSERLNSIIQKSISQGKGCITAIGIGLNPSCKFVGNILEDEKALGTMHLILGRELIEGAEINFSCGYKFLFFNPTISLVGDVGRKCSFLYRDERENIAGKSLDWAAYKLLFENSNDPQYILDIETKKFVLVNPAFCSLVGYSKEELESGKVTASDVTAKESHELLDAKAKLRKSGTLNREVYDFRILTRSGNVIPVEVSVQKSILNGREVVVGSVRDLTERRNFMNQLRESAIKSAKNTVRVHNLVEKIKGVPILVSTLLKADSEKELFSVLTKSLHDIKELAFEEIILFMRRDNDLVPYPSSDRVSKEKMAELYETAKRVLQTEQNTALADNIHFFTVNGRKGILGVLCIIIDKRELEFISQNVQVRNGYFETLTTISHTIGLVIENLALYKKVEQQSLTDPLTGVFNRRFFDRKLLEEFERAKRYGRELSLLVIDMDKLKYINDNFGHPSGDLSLRKIATIFKSNTREIDVVCRVGGDEFAIIMPETSVANAKIKAEILCRIVGDEVLFVDEKSQSPVKTSVSIGVSGLKEGMNIYNDLFNSADNAQYIAKKSGGNRVVVAE